MSGRGKKLKAHQILEKLEAELPSEKAVLYRGFFLGVLSEVNYLLNEIFWDFFDTGKRREEFLKAISGSPETITQDKGFWLGRSGEGKMVRKHLDCLGKRNFSECLKIYFDECPGKKEYFNEHLRMRFLIFYKDTEDFLKAVGELCGLRNHLAHLEESGNRLSGENLRLSLYSLCYLVHPQFFGLLKGKVRDLSRGHSFGGFVDEAFEEIQTERKECIKEQRKQFFEYYKTRRLKGRQITRNWNRFKERWDKSKEEWKSEYRLQNFIYQYQRINPEGIREFVRQYFPQSAPSFRDVEEIHGLFSNLDLLLWEYLPQDSESDQGINKLRNCLAHNEKAGVSKNRCFKNEFGALMNCLSPVLANEFYTKAESILKKRNHRVDKKTKAKVRYKKGEEYCKENLENPKLLKSVAARIKNELKEARRGKSGT